MWNVTQGWARKGGRRVFPRGGVKQAVCAVMQSWPRCIQGRPSKTKMWEIERLEMQIHAYGVVELAVSDLGRHP
jgi:hypothetical protein